MCRGYLLLLTLALCVIGSQSRHGRLVRRNSGGGPTIAGSSTTQGTTEGAAQGSSEATTTSGDTATSETTQKATTAGDAAASETTPDATAAASETTPDATPDATASETTPDATASETTPDAATSETTPAATSETTPDATAATSETTQDATAATSETTQDATTAGDAATSETTPEATQETTPRGTGAAESSTTNSYVSETISTGFTNDFVTDFPPDDVVYVSRFSERVIDVSSEYGDMWAADSIVGKPNVYPRYGDFPGAWQQLMATSKVDEWIIVQIDIHIFIESVAIYETYNSGRVVNIDIASPYGCWFSAWSRRKPEFLNYARKFEPLFLNYPEFNSDTVKVTTRPSAVGWVNIDSVEVTGELAGDVAKKTARSRYRSKVRSL